MVGVVSLSTTDVSTRRLSAELVLVGIRVWLGLVRSVDP